MKHSTAKQQNLEPIFPENHELGQRIFYDPKEGRYYDAFTDFYMDQDYNPLSYSQPTQQPILDN